MQNVFFWRAYFSGMSSYFTYTNTRTHFGVLPLECTTPAGWAPPTPELYPSFLLSHLEELSSAPAVLPWRSPQHVEDVQSASVAPTDWHHLCGNWQAGLIYLNDPLAWFNSAYLSGDKRNGSHFPESDRIFLLSHLSREEVDARRWILLPGLIPRFGRHAWDEFNKLGFVCSVVVFKTRMWSISTLLVKWWSAAALTRVLFYSRSPKM